MKSDNDVITVDDLSGARDRDDLKGEDAAETEDEAETDNESEDEIESVHNDHENDQNITAETHKSAAEGSTRLIERVFKGAKALTKNVVERIGDLGAAAKSALVGREQPVYKLLYETEKITIDLPYGKGPKTHCRMITYKPIKCKGSPCPLISLTIKPSGRCRHEDTHLFVRFTGYNYNSFCCDQ